MKMNLNKKIGKRNYGFQFDGDDLWEVIMDSQHLSFGDVDKCGLCGSDDLKLFAYKTKEKGFKYAKVVCNACRASVTLGQVKADPKTFYLHKNEDYTVKWEAYVGKDAVPEPAPTSDIPPSDDVPF